MKGSKVLVLGAAGFVGSSLANYLSDVGADAIGIDKIYPESFRELNPKVRFRKCEVEELTDADVSADLDYIFHFAEYARVEQSFDDIDEVFKRNYGPLYKVLRLAKESNAKLIYAGSSTKFSDNGPSSSPYAWTKSTNSNLVKSYAEWTGLNYAIVYLYNVFGIGEQGTGRYGTVVEKFLRAKMLGEAVTINGPGSQTRNFTHIEDVIQGLVTVAKNGEGDDYGIASDEKCSVIELADMIGVDYVIGSNSRGNRESAEIRNHKTKELGWNSKVKLKEYIKERLGESYSCR